VKSESSTELKTDYLNIRMLYALFSADQTNLYSVLQSMMFLVGTGASCVYPLLAAKLHGWQFIATDADATNIDFATANVLRNNLTDKIKGEFTS